MGDTKNLGESSAADGTSAIGQRRGRRDKAITFNAVGISLIVIFFAILSILLIVEASGRLEILRLVDSEINRLARAESSQDQPADRTSIKELQILSYHIQALISVGSSATPKDAHQIYCEVTKVITKADCPSKKTLFIRGWSSDLLLAALMICCSTIGVCSSVFVDRKRMHSLRRPPFGLLAIGWGGGFLTFLVLKGGRNFFLADFSLGTEIVANPYSMGLAATVVGLFSIDMYDRLDLWVTRFGTNESNRSDDNEPKKPAEVTEDERAAKVTPAAQDKGGYPK